MKNKVYVYDIEIYPNLFLVSFLPLSVDRNLIKDYEFNDIQKDEVRKKEIAKELGIRTFIVYRDTQQNDYLALMDFINTEVYMLIGYNSYNYDNIIIDYLHIKKPKTVDELLSYATIMSDRIISNREIGIRYHDSDFKFYKPMYNSIDLQRLMYLDKKFVSLKQVAIQLKHYRVQNLPYDFNYHIKPDELELIVDYNYNDLFITHKLYWDKRVNEEALLRFNINKLYGVKVESESRSKIADILFTKFYSDYTELKPFQFRGLRTQRRVVNFREIIDPKIEFTTPELQQFLDRIKSTKLHVGVDTFKEQVVFRGVAYSLMLGGLHSEDRPGIFESTDKVKLMDGDVSSFYPMIILNNRISPKHLDKAVFLAIMAMMTKERLKAKALWIEFNKFDDKVKAEALKIVINVVFGKFNDEFSFLNDVQCTYQTTINGQLYLLWWIEQLEVNSIHVISANTDGIVSKIPTNKLDDYYKCGEAFCKTFNFEVEYTEYARYIRTAVNDYFTVKPNGKLKEKGFFLSEVGLDKGYDAPIISYAVKQHYLTGRTITDIVHTYLDECKTKGIDGIYDFCISVKTGGQFINEFHSVIDGNYEIDEIQKNIRYYVANFGGALIKKYKDKAKRIKLVSGKTTVLFNDYFNVEDFADYDIDYKYYIGRAIDVINQIQGVRMKDIKKSGSLFDNIE